MQLSKFLIPLAEEALFPLYIVSSVEDELQVCRFISGLYSISLIQLSVFGQYHAILITVPL